MSRPDPVAVAHRAATAGGEVAVAAFREDIDVETKADKTDFLTRADSETQDRVVEVIREADPDSAVVGEENDARKDVPAEGRAWIIDPIDGTNNFVRGLNHWCTSVAYVEDGTPLAAANVLPAVGDSYVAGPGGFQRNGETVTVSTRKDPETFTVAPTFWWDFDRREEFAAACEAIVTRFGDLARPKSIQVILSLVAAGAIEGAITNVRPNPWDSIAGAYMVEQAGGTVTDIHGDPWTHDSQGLVASNGTAHDELLAATRAVETVRES